MVGGGWGGVVGGGGGGGGVVAADELVHLSHTRSPTGVGAVANALHALTLLIARQVVGELEDLDPSIEYFVVPPLCPLAGSPYDFSRTADHVERAIHSTDAWLARNGLQKSGIPDEMRPHAH